jgi:hypothetical protein
MFQFLIYVGLPLGFIPFLLLLFFKIEKFVFNRLLPVYLLIFVSSFYELVFSSIFRIDVRNWFLIYGILSFSCFTHYFYVLLQKRFKILFIGFIIFSALFRLGFYVPFSPYFDLSFLLKDGFCSAFDTLVFAICSILWFRKLFIEMTEESFLQNSDFYIVSGLIMYYFGTVLVFLMSNAINTANPKALNQIWIFNIIMNIVFRTLLIVALIVQQKKQRSILS